MSLWICPRHGLYGGQVFCPTCGGTGSYATVVRDTDGSLKGQTRRGLDGEAATAGAEGIAKDQPA